MNYLVVSFASFPSELLLDDDEDDFARLRFELGFSRDKDRRLALVPELLIQEDKKTVFRGKVSICNTLIVNWICPFDSKFAYLNELLSPDF
jgi:hypothetical protein